jgi:hypothetical protein
MPRPLQRVRLESGFKLDLNRLARRGFIKPGAITGPVGIVWTEERLFKELQARGDRAKLMQLFGH